MPLRCGVTIRGRSLRMIHALYGLHRRSLVHYSCRMPWISSMNPSPSVTGTPTHTRSDDGAVRSRGSSRGHIETDDNSFCPLNMPMSYASSLHQVIACSHLVKAYGWATAIPGRSMASPSYGMASLCETIPASCLPSCRMTTAQKQQWEKLWPSYIPQSPSARSGNRASQ